MMFAILFEDDPTRGDMRQKHMPAHLEFLARNAARIKAAGPLKQAQDGAPAGGLWIVDAATADEATALTREDPFWPTGLRTSIRVLAWTRVFADGKRLVQSDGAISSPTASGPSADAGSRSARASPDGLWSPGYRRAFRPRR